MAAILSRPQCVKRAKHGLTVRQMQMQIRISFVLQTTAEGDKQNFKGYTSTAYMLCDTVEIQIKRDGFNTQRHW